MGRCTSARFSLEDVACAEAATKRSSGQSETCAVFDQSLRLLALSSPHTFLGRCIIVLCWLTKLVLNRAKCKSLLISAALDPSSFALLTGWMGLVTLQALLLARNTSSSNVSFFLIESTAYSPSRLLVCLGFEAATLPLLWDAFWCLLFPIAFFLD